MKKHLAVALSIVVTLAGGFAFGEEKAESHEQHHPEAQVKEKPSEKAATGGMKMEDMMGMMHECMSMHKDGKMCDHQAMEKCQENMKKGECQKMMKQAKSQEKGKIKK